MSKNINISIPKPCHEEWERFTPTQKGRFCGACQKEVIDFTHWNDEDIKHFFCPTQNLPVEDLGQRN